ncbi:MAG: pyridoxamine 5'-phosphate oxidase family protein [Pseudomonadota bacterium]|nr:pyridoxamine 5'-phosphate oxidase family protein [Pseudomonadota bacterium]
MRPMTDEEIATLVRRSKWATICSASSEGVPYAVEATPYSDGGDVCFMINPRGGTWKNLCSNPKVLLKYTLTNSRLTWWAGVSAFGTGRFDPDPEAISRGFLLLGEVMGEDYSGAASRPSRPGFSPLLRVTVEQWTGRCSAAPDTPLFTSSSPL